MTRGMPVGAPVPPLTRWGLSPDADLIYRTLVTFGASSTESLARTLGLSPRRAADAAEELDAAGAVRRMRTAPRRHSARWAPLPPEEVIAGLHRRLVPTRRAVPAALAPRLDPHDSGRAIRGPDLVAARIADLVAGARHEHLVMNPGPHVDLFTMAATTPRNGGSFGDGLALRMLGGVPPPRKPRPGERACSQALRPGGQCRLNTELPTQLLIVDRRTMLVPFTQPTPDWVVLEVAAPAVVQSFVALFEREWDAGHDAGLSSGIELSDRERALLALLAAGLPDHAAAERLHYSTRTVTNILRALMDRLGVQNRFQLGLVLGGAGLVLPVSEPDG